MGLSNVAGRSVLDVRKIACCAPPPTSNEIAQSSLARVERVSRLAQTIVNNRLPLVGPPLRRLVSALRIRREFREDMRAYTTTSVWRPPAQRDSASIQRELTYWYHQVEKALTFRKIKRPFGARARDGLKIAFDSPQLSDVSSTVVAAASDALGALSAWNDDGSISNNVAPHAEVPKEWEGAQSFFSTRRSCRDFDPRRRVSAEVIYEALRRAQHTPSVCNRQAPRAHLLQTESIVASALALQSGNRGFGESVQQLFVITADRRAFSEAEERNQGWIDGGLFAMTLVWALHSLGISSCMLNWSMGVTATRKLRSVLGLPDHEDVICMVAIGYARPGSRAARSQRLPINEILTEH